MATLHDDSRLEVESRSKPDRVARLMAIGLAILILAAGAAVFIGSALG